MNSLIYYKMRGLELLNQRVQDLLEDGYYIVINYKNNSLCLVKLRHHNGNRITLAFHILDGTITQRTNNIQVYSHKVY